MHLTLIASLLLFFCSTASYAEDKEDGVPTISYYEIKPSLVANLASGGKYIRTDIQVMTRDETYKESLELHGPAIRHTLLLLLSEQDGRTIKTPEGKEALRQEALTQVSQVMKDLSGKDSLQELFFTTFFVQ
ncbi:MAG: flagellar basal body-associated FliL family protein [Gammaproteobacteria bacterium]|nr:flagellar basal body-associated FliL family protein [Gammaproteobacteria bacterium]